MKFYGKAESAAKQIVSAFQAGNLPQALAPIFVHRRDSIPMSAWSWHNQLLCVLAGCEDLDQGVLRFAHLRHKPADVLSRLPVIAIAQLELAQAGLGEHGGRRQPSHPAAIGTGAGPELTRGHPFAVTSPTPYVFVIRHDSGSCRDCNPVRPEEKTGGRRNHTARPGAAFTREYGRVR